MAGIKSIALIIDAVHNGNWTRHMNHAETEAEETEAEETVEQRNCIYKGQPVPVFFAKRDIKAGEALRFTYANSVTEEMLRRESEQLELDLIKGLKNTEISNEIQKIYEKKLAQSIINVELFEYDKTHLDQI